MSGATSMVYTVRIILLGDLSPGAMLSRSIRDKSFLDR